MLMLPSLGSLVRAVRLVSAMRFAREREASLLKVDVAWFRSLVSQLVSAVRCSLGFRV